MALLVSAYPLVPSLRTFQPLRRHMGRNNPLRSQSDPEPEFKVKELGVPEDPKGEAPATPTPMFLSQEPIDIEKVKAETDLTDPKQQRVIIYIIASLVPVLFLVPLMLGSRDLLPLDALPPVPLD